LKCYLARPRLGMVNSYPARDHQAESYPAYELGILEQLDVEPEPELQLGGRPARPVLLDERSPARTAPTHNPVDTWPATSAGDWAEPSPRG